MRHPFAASVATWTVRPADGNRLRPVHDLCSGDEVVAFDGTAHPVAAVWPARDGWWMIGYRGGPYAAVPAGAVVPDRVVVPHDLEPPTAVLKKDRHRRSFARRKAPVEDATEGGVFHIYLCRVRRANSTTEAAAARAGLFARVRNSYRQTGMSTTMSFGTG